MVWKDFFFNKFRMLEYDFFYIVLIYGIYFLCWIMNICIFYRDIVLEGVILVEINKNLDEIVDFVLEL